MSGLPALLLDLANMLGGFLLAIGLIRRNPRADPERGADRLAPLAWGIGVFALVTGGGWLMVHLIAGPHLLPFELVAVAVGLMLLWGRISGRRPLAGGDRGAALLVAIFGLIAIIVGVQGILTPER